LRDPEFCLNESVSTLIINFVLKRFGKKNLKKSLQNFSVVGKQTMNNRQSFVVKTRTQIISETLNET
jgi:hypothetical protein